MRFGSAGRGADRLGTRAVPQLRRQVRVRLGAAAGIFHTRRVRIRAGRTIVACHFLVIAGGVASMPFAKAAGSADNRASVVSWSGEHMKALFLGYFAASVAPRVLARVKTPLETSILDDEGDVEHL